MAQIASYCVREAFEKVFWFLVGKCLQNMKEEVCDGSQSESPVTHSENHPPLSYSQAERTSCNDKELGSIAPG